MQSNSFQFSEQDVFQDGDRRNIPVFARLAIYVCIFTGIYATRLGGYLFFHVVAEVFSMIVACGVFMLAWNSQRYMKNNYFLFVGIAYLFIGSLDFLHTISYKGMGIFPHLSSNTAIELWVAARYFEAISLFVASFFISRRMSGTGVLAGYVVAFTLTVLSIYHWGFFPDCFVDGVGLTPFKVISEYVVCGILAVTFAVLVLNREKFAPRVLALFLGAIGLTIFAELIFTLYSTLFGWMNLAGHLLKIVSFLLIYNAIIVTGFEQPFDFMFREIKLKEEMIIEDREKLHRIIENLPAGAVHIDEEGFYANPLFKKITGCGESESEDAEWLKNCLGIVGAGVDQTRHGSTSEVSLRNKEGKDKILEVTIHRYGVEEVILVIDVTEKRKQELERENLLAKLEEKNREIEVFTYGISHDLKSPLVTIEGFSGILKDELADHMTEDIEKYLGKIVGASENMRGMIEDLLEFSRMGTTKEESTPVVLSEIVREVIDNLSGPVRQSGAQIQVVNADLEILVKRNMVARLFENLIGNALKYGGKDGQPPEIEVGVAEHGGREMIFVGDNGHGIPEEYQEKIFDVFFRCPQTRKIEGTGVGLAIVKKVVENHGGEIVYDRSGNNGCKFYFTLS